MNVVLIIPARYQSGRFPGKPLTDLVGRTLIQRTYGQCAKAFDPKQIFVATDDERIRRHCQECGMNVVMTSAKCLTGTDRVAEVSCMIDADYYINVQGDEPVFNPDDIRKILDAVPRFPGEILNGYCPLSDEALFLNRSIPKVVFREDGRLLYMSRAPIPTNKKNSFVKAWRQVCVYAFPKKALLDFTGSRRKTVLESIEDIEILRFLELGWDVRMIELSADSIAVDHPGDIEKVIARIEQDPGRYE